MATAQNRLESTMARLDSVLDQRLRREEQELARQDASLEEARRQRQRANAEERRQIAEVYDDAFRWFGTTVPEPADDEAPSRYRARLFNRLVRRLPEGHEWSRTRADDLPSGSALDNIEQLIIEAAKREGAKPSTENLPDDGTMVARHRSDANTGTRFTEFFGRESFIKSMGREGRRVARIVDPRSQTVIWGRNFDQAH